MCKYETFPLEKILPVLQENLTIYCNADNRDPVELKWIKIKNKT